MTEITSAANETTTHTITAADIGHKIVCKVTGKASDYSGATATTVASALVVGNANVVVTRTGTALANNNTAKVGDVLTAEVTDSATGDLTSLENTVYSWKVGGTEVDTDNSYTVQAADAGKTITLTVSGKTAGSIVAKTSGTLSWNNYDVKIAATSLTATLDAATYAAGATMTVTAAGGSGTYTYSWVDLYTGTVIGTGKTATMLGKYTSGVKVIVTDSNGNTAEDTATVTP